MTSWTDGYVAEIDYTHGYYRELSPMLMMHAMLSKAQAHRVGRPIRYLELGFGQGLSLNIHAAALEGEFWGTDFNPTQAANARALAEASGANVKVLDNSFAELAARDDLPEFDVIGLHGIWSWISDENRRVIVDIARRKLAVGGIMYVSYNTTPGWSASMPLRHLMTMHADLASPEGAGIVDRIEAAIGFTEKLIETGAGYFRANPIVAERVKGIKTQNRNYLAHEFFNADWHPMSFSQLDDYLTEAKLTFASSAALLDHVDLINLTQPQIELLSSIKNPVLRETVRDYCVNQQFRRDLFVKGPRRLSLTQQEQAIREARFILTTPVAELPKKLRGGIGEATLPEKLYGPVAAALAANGYAPKTVAEMIDIAPELRSITLQSIFQALSVLAAQSHVTPAQAPEQVSAVARRTSALNAHLMERAVYSSDISFLASPVMGGGLAVGRVQQLMIRSLMKGKKLPQEVALDVWSVLESQGHRLTRDGKTIEAATENIAELSRGAQSFFETRLPILNAAGLLLHASPAAGAASTSALADQKPGTGASGTRAA